jgi:hypothetical protein
MTHSYFFDFCKELFGNIEIREEVRENCGLCTNFGISNENPNFLLQIIILRIISCTIDYSFIFCDSRFRDFRKISRTSKLTETNGNVPKWHIISQCFSFINHMVTSDLGLRLFFREFAKFAIIICNKKWGFSFEIPKLVPSSRFSRTSSRISILPKSSLQKSKRYLLFFFLFRKLQQIRSNLSGSYIGGHPVSRTEIQWLYIVYS